MDKQKQMRFTDSELGIIKNTFSDQDALLKAIRKVFLQMELSASEQKMIEKMSKNTEVVGVLRKSFLPTLDGDAPIHQVVDLWMTLEIKGKDVDVVYHDALARQKLIQYLDERLSFLEGNHSDDAIQFSQLAKIDNKDALSVYINLTVRNIVLAHTDMQLQQLSILAGTNEETVDETKERLFKNSAK